MNSDKPLFTAPPVLNRLKQLQLSHTHQMSALSEIEIEMLAMHQSKAGLVNDETLF